MGWNNLVPVVGVGGGVACDIVDRLTECEERKIGIASEAAGETAARYAAGTVLERIVIDRSAHLADEIEDRREKPLNRIP